jgi:biopolymer transport protein ExbB/TolQ
MIETLVSSPFLWPIVVCGVAALAILVERAWYLSLRAAIDADAFLGGVTTALLAGNFDRALRLCVAEPHAPVTSVARAALVHAASPREDLALAVESAVGQATSKVTRRVAYLPTLANVATLFGLLGTILGLIQSFAAVSQADTAQRQTMLAEGISHAMQATAGGISVAIPSLIGYAILAQRANHLLDDLDRVAQEVQLAIHARRRAAAPGVVVEAAPEPIVATEQPA